MLFPYPNLAIPALNLVSDFRMRVKLNSQSASMAVGDGFKKWTTFTEGEWSGQLGHGIVIVSDRPNQCLAAMKRDNGDENNSAFFLLSMRSKGANVDDNEE